MSNSPLVNHTHISPNKNVPRNHAIDTITIHCVVGQASVESLGNLFGQSSRGASSNYGVGCDGRIGMYVEEKDRSWCSSNAVNDNRAITIEVASDTTEPYAVRDVAYNSLINLVADICKRNGIKKLIWSTDKNTRVNHLNGCNMTVHRDYANKSCPGTFLYERMGDIANKVNAIIDVDEIYRVQVGAFRVKDNAVKLEAELKGKGFATYIREDDGIYRVQCGAFREKKNAEELLAKLVAQGYQAFIRTGEAPAPTPKKKSVEEIAREVILGKWGNYPERKTWLEQAGYNYEEVRKIVNKLI